jgi:hypothetical protein
LLTGVLTVAVGRGADAFDGTPQGALRELVCEVALVFRGAPVVERG